MDRLRYIKQVAYLDTVNGTVIVSDKDRTYKTNDTVFSSLPEFFEDTVNHVEENYIGVVGIIQDTINLIFTTHGGIGTLTYSKIPFKAIYYSGQLAYTPDDYEKTIKFSPTRQNFGIRSHNLAYIMHPRILNKALISDAYYFIPIYDDHSYGIGPPMLLSVNLFLNVLQKQVPSDYEFFNSFLTEHKISKNAYILVPPNLFMPYYYNEMKPINVKWIARSIRYRQISKKPRNEVFYGEPTDTNALLQLPVAYVSKFINNKEFRYVLSDPYTTSVIICPEGVDNVEEIPTFRQSSYKQYGVMQKYSKKQVLSICIPEIEKYVLHSAHHIIGLLCMNDKNKYIYNLQTYRRGQFNTNEKALFYLLLSVRRPDLYAVRYRTERALDIRKYIANSF